MADYELLTTKLRLPGAVLIQPLTPHQVEAYLTETGPELAALREVLRYDEPLQELAQSPLMLSTCGQTVVFFRLRITRIHPQRVFLWQVC